MSFGNFAPSIPSSEYLYSSKIRPLRDMPVGGNKMEEFIIAALEFVLELIIDVGINWPVAEADPANRRHIDLSLVWQCLLYAIVGVFIAFISLHFFPYAWISNPILQILNLLLAPCFAAFIAYVFAKRRVNQMVSASPRVRAWKSYCLTLALVLVRYTFGKHA
jgi:hypothetical protein